MIGELLYGLTNRDLGAIYLETISRNIPAVAAAATIVEINFTVPDGRLLLVTAAAVQGEAGAAQLCTGLFIGIRRADGTDANIVRDVDTARAQLNRSFNSSGAEFWIKGGDTLRGRASFDAGVNANTVRLSFAGMTLPLGNVASG